MKINLIFGFLGSGKTTLIRRFLKDQSDLSKTAVIVNEFGDVGIDGLIIEGEHVDVVELNSGCLCCNLKGPMLDAIDEIEATHNVETLFIESSGVAEPIDTLKAFTDPNLHSKIEIGPIVTVINSPHFGKLREVLGDFFTDQIRHADVLILNKIDLIDSVESEDIRVGVRELNHKADFLYAEQCDVNLNELFETDTRSIDDFVARINGLHRSSTEHHEHEHERMDSLVVANIHNVERQHLEHWFLSLPGHLYRAKGFVTVDGERCLVQFSMGQLNVERTDQSNPSHMVFIGQNIDRSLIKNQYESLGSTPD